MNEKNLTTNTKYLGSLKIVFINEKGEETEGNGLHLIKTSAPFFTSKHIK